MNEIKITDEGYGRFTKPEMDAIIMAFKDNDNLLKILRKVFLPDANWTNPLGQLVGPYLQIAVDNRNAEDIALDVKAFNKVWGHIEFRLQELQSLAQAKVESEQERVLRNKLNSNK